jgi:hypothetical protein
MRRYASCAVNEPGDDDIEQKLPAIRNAGGFDLTVPGCRRGLEEAALLREWVLHRLGPLRAPQLGLVIDCDGDRGHHTFYVTGSRPAAADLGRSRR